MKSTKTAKTPTPRRGTSPDNPTALPRIHTRPSIGDPDRVQEFPEEAELPDLDNETVHRTARPEGAILEDDDSGDQAAQEKQEDELLRRN